MWNMWVTQALVLGKGETRGSFVILFFTFLRDRGFEEMGRRGWRDGAMGEDLGTGTVVA